MNNREENNWLASIFLPRYLGWVEQLKSSGNNLVRYTSAATALRILKHHEIWMRNTRCMNDFLEVKYGINLFKKLCRRPEFIQLRCLWKSGQSRWSGDIAGYWRIWLLDKHHIYSMLFWTYAWGKSIWAAFYVAWLWEWFQCGFCFETWFVYYWK